jgi:hypothetical protein
MSITINVTISTHRSREQREEQHTDIKKSQEES